MGEACQKAGSESQEAAPMPGHVQAVRFEGKEWWCEPGYQRLDHRACNTLLDGSAHHSLRSLALGHSLSMCVALLSVTCQIYNRTCQSILRCFSILCSLPSDIKNLWQLALMVLRACVVQSMSRKRGNSEGFLPHGGNVLPSFCT